MSRKKIIYLIILILLLVSNFYFVARYRAIEKELQEIKKPVEVQEINTKVLNFTKLFIEKVLKAGGEIDFETRLKLENAVRDIGDPEILAQWQKFVDSKSETEAQQEVKNLLELLVNKIKLPQ